MHMTGRTFTEPVSAPMGASSGLEAGMTWASLWGIINPWTRRLLGCLDRMVVMIPKGRITPNSQTSEQRVLLKPLSAPQGDKKGVTGWRLVSEGITLHPTICPRPQ